MMSSFIIHLIQDRCVIAVQEFISVSAGGDYYVSAESCRDRSWFLAEGVRFVTLPRTYTPKAVLGFSEIFPDPPN